MSARSRILPSSYQQATQYKRRTQWNKALLIVLFTLPGMFLFFMFVLVPIGQSAVFSLYKWDGYGVPTNFIGLGNYNALIHNATFQLSVGHTFGIMGLSLTIQLPLALGLALLVGRGKLHFKRAFRMILFIPYVFSEVITGIIWRYVMTPGSNGVANMVLGSIIPGFQPILWLADPSIVLYAYFIVLTWKYFGFHMILYMAGLQSIPADLEDAARVDGATEPNVLRHITLPMLGSTIRLTIFLSVLGSFQQFVLVWVLTQGGPVNASEVVATYLYKYGITRSQLGYGSAIAIILFAIGFVFSLGYQRIVMRQDFAVEKI